MKLVAHVIPILVAFSAELWENCFCVHCSNRRTRTYRRIWWSCLLILWWIVSVIQTAAYWYTVIIRKVWWSWWKWSCWTLLRIGCGVYLADNCSLVFFTVDITKRGQSACVNVTDTLFIPVPVVGLTTCPREWKGCSISIRKSKKIVLKLTCFLVEIHTCPLPTCQLHQSTPLKNNEEWDTWYFSNIQMYVAPLPAAWEADSPLDVDIHLRK